MNAELVEAQLEYALTIRIKISAMDDIAARSRAQEMLNLAQAGIYDLVQDVKLQRLNKNAAPDKIEL